MTTPVNCVLLVDGVRVADGTPGDPDQAPTALTGLSVTWGRSTTVDQVEPSTCSFQLMDPPGAGSFLDLLYTGARVDVVAAADVPGTGDPINTDGGFESAAPGAVPAWRDIVGGTALVTAAQAHTGAQSVVLTPAVLTMSATMPPAAPSADPTAWDHVQTLQAGQTWQLAGWLLPPLGGQVGWQPVTFTNPNAAGAAAGPVLQLPYDALQPDWRPVQAAVTVTAAQTGRWLGVKLTATVAAWQQIHGYPPGMAWQDTPATWADWTPGYVDDAAVAPPSDAPVHRDVTVFSGRVTDLDAGWDFNVGTVVVSVTAADFTADLAQRDVGAQPWPMETVAARFAHIVAASGVAIPYTIAPSLRSWRVSWLDVDRQQAWPLLADLATSVDGVLWSATHRTTGPRLWLADPRAGAALYVLYEGDDGLVHVGPTDALAAAIELDACDVLLEPVVFKQAVSDVVTRVSITWLEQTVDDGGLPAPTEHTDVYTDAALEVQLGTRGASVSTQLVSAGDAGSVAALLLGRLHLQSWRVGGLAWQTETTDMNPDQTTRALDLLDGTRRLAAPILLTNLPVWAPSGGATLPLMLQGGTYTYAYGAWVLELTTSSAAAQGASLPWNDLDPGWAWNEFAPDVAWADLVGVAA